MMTDLYYHNIEILEGKILSKYIYLLQLCLQKDNLKKLNEERSVKAIKIEIQTVKNTISKLEAKKVLLTL